MPILHFYDRATLLAARDLPFDPELHALLTARVAHLAAQGLLNMSEIIVVGPDSTAAEIIAAIGFDPLTDPEGRSYGQPGFVSTAIDYVARVSESYYEAIVCVGNSGFGYQLLVRDDAAPALVALMRELAA